MPKLGRVVIYRNVSLSITRLGITSLFSSSPLHHAFCSVSLTATTWPSTSRNMNYRSSSAVDKKWWWVSVFVFLVCWSAPKILSEYLELILRHRVITSCYPLDQTPTPTRFLKNIEESGLFDELQTNPFDQVLPLALAVATSHVTIFSCNILP